MNELATQSPTTDSGSFFLELTDDKEAVVMLKLSEWLSDSGILVANIYIFSLFSQLSTKNLYPFRIISPLSQTSITHFPFVFP